MDTDVMINFTASLATTPEARLKAAKAAALARVGVEFYELTEEDKANTIEQEYQKLFGPTIPSIKESSNVESALMVEMARVHTQATDITSAPYIPDTSFIRNTARDITIPRNDTIYIDTNREEKTITQRELDEQKKLAPDPDASLDPPFAKKSFESFALSNKLNAKQQLGADFADAGKCFVFTGPAGCGKTFGCVEIARRLLHSGKLSTHDFKLPNGAGRYIAPSVAFIAYTNRAADNMRRALHKDPELEQELMVNVLTVHRLLEYEPEFFDRPDGSTGMRFIPMRHKYNKLRITHLVIEESSMLGIDLWLKLYEALQAGVQIIFVGDINQLQPVFGKAILNYALVELPVVELTEIYRQALDNPIIANAHLCLQGKPLEPDGKYVKVIDGKALKKIPSETTCVNLLINSLTKWVKESKDNVFTGYDPEQDIILCPYGKENKAKGSQANTTAINNHIAQMLGNMRNAMVYEVIAGMRKLYLAVGDRVMVEKQDGIITKINHNGRYVGKMPQPASTELTRFGIRVINTDHIQTDEDFELALEGYEHLNIDDISNEDEKRVQETSHIVDVALDNGNTVVLHSSGDFAESVFSLGYALTVHKSQGCEWRKVIVFLHRNHAAMLHRELLYTAMTRAREVLFIVDLCNMVPQAIANQRIKGTSVQDKIEWFNSEISLAEPVPVIP